MGVKTGGPARPVFPWQQSRMRKHQRSLPDRGDPLCCVRLRRAAAGELRAAPRWFYRHAFRRRHHRQPPETPGNASAPAGRAPSAAGRPEQRNVGGTPYIRITCRYNAFGRVTATLQQPVGDGDSVIRTSTRTQVGCSPTPTRVYLPIDAGNGSPGSFHPGSATLNVEARIEDPNYSEYETDAEVVRSASRHIRIRLP